MKYKQITVIKRGAIEGLLQADCTLKRIAKIIGVSLSAVSREIKKRRTPSGYVKLEVAVFEV